MDQERKKMLTKKQMEMLSMCDRWQRLATHYSNKIMQEFEGCVSTDIPATTYTMKLVLKDSKQQKKTLKKIFGIICYSPIGPVELLLDGTLRLDMGHDSLIGDLNALLLAIHKAVHREGTPVPFWMPCEINEDALPIK